MAETNEKHLDLAYDLTGGAWLLSPDGSYSHAYVIHLPNPGTTDEMPARGDLINDGLIGDLLTDWHKAGWHCWEVMEDELYHFLVTGMDSYPCPGCSAEGLRQARFEKTVEIIEAIATRTTNQINDTENESDLRDIVESAVSEAVFRTQTLDHHQLRTAFESD
jgi:hypothetical protein